MPLFVAGKTLCPLCEKSIQHDDRRVGFPSFLKPTHSLSILSDAVVHEICFDSWEHRGTFLDLLGRFKRIGDARPADLHWRDGELWIKARGEDFDREAESLDPAKINPTGPHAQHK
jgi:hypothetical protein